MSGKLGTNFIAFASASGGLITGSHATKHVSMAATASTLTLDGASGADVILAGIADPTADQHAATRKFVLDQVNGLQWKASVRAATTGNGTLSTDFANGQSLDNVTLATGDRILIKDQTAGQENGIYTVNASGAPSRAVDFDAPTDNVRGAAVLVREGLVNVDRAYQCTNDAAVTFDTTPIVFAAFVNTAGTLADSVVTNAKLAADAVTNVKIANSTIENAKLVNSSISGVSLGSNLNDLTVDNSTLAFNSGTTFNGSTARTVSIKDLGVTAGKLAADSVITAKILNANVTTAKIADANVTAAKLAADSVVTAKILNANVTTAKIADANVTTDKIADANVTTAKIADDAVTLDKMAGLARGSLIVGNASGNPSALVVGSANTILKCDGTDAAYGQVVNADVSASAAIEFSKMENLDQGSILLGNGSNKAAALDAKGNGKLLIGNGTTVTSVAMSGDINIDNAGLTTIQADAVHASMMHDDCISGHDELAHADIVDADEMLISDGGTLKRVGVDSLRDHFFGVVSGDATIADGGELTIGANTVEHSMLNNNVISGLTALGSAGVAQVDELMFSDAGELKKVTFSNFEDSIFANVSGDATIAAGGALTIGADAVQTGMLHDDCATGLAGAGLTATTGVLNIISGANTGLNVAADAMNLDMNDLSEAAISVANDSFAFVDADDSNATKKESIADLMAAVAGDAITASAGVLAVGVDDSGIEINSDALRLKDNGVTYDKLQDAADGHTVLGRSASTSGGHAEIAIQTGALLGRDYTGTTLQSLREPQLTSCTVGAAGNLIKLSATGTNGAGQLQLNVGNAGNRTLTMSGDINVAGDFTLSNNDFTINAVAAGKTLAMNESLTIGDGFDGTLTFAAASKTLTVSETVTLNQSVSTTDSVEFADVHVSSDVSLKTNIQTIENGLDVINAIEPVTWDWKRNGEQSSGIIAQQLEETLPFLINNGKDHKRVNYNGLHGFLISAVQQLSKQVNELKQ